MYQAGYVLGRVVHVRAVPACRCLVVYMPVVPLLYMPHGTLLTMGTGHWYTLTLPDTVLPNSIKYTVLCTFYSLAV